MRELVKLKWDDRVERERIWQWWTGWSFAVVVAEGFLIALALYNWMRYR